MIPMEALVDRCVYRIGSRNLDYGVWVAKRRGFIGIREKFGDKFLFMEYHYDADPVLGTVFDAVPTIFKVPGSIRVSEYEPKSRCATCGGFLYRIYGRYVTQKTVQNNEKYGWNIYGKFVDFHEGGFNLHEPDVRIYVNQDLLNFLLSVEKDDRMFSSG